MTNTPVSPEVAEIANSIADAPPLSIVHDGKEILRLDQDGKLTIDPANVEEAAKQFVTSVASFCKEVGAGNPFSRPIPTDTQSRDGLVEALEPFAAVAEWDIGENEDDDDLYRVMTGGHNYAPLLKVGDLRRAREVFEALRSASGEATEPSAALSDEAVERVRAVLDQQLPRGGYDTLLLARLIRAALTASIPDAAPELDEKAIRHDERKKIIAAGCIHTTKAQARADERPDIRAWQEAQSEWFDATICEIVSEYAEWRDRPAALPATAPDPFGWVDGLKWHELGHRAVLASVRLGGWLSAALDDPKVCDAMKADIVGAYPSIAVCGGDSNLEGGHCY